MRERLLTMLEPAIQGMGFELVELEFRDNPADGLLRIYIDRADGITVDDCEFVSHQISGVLDVEDPIPFAYALEVSSPGLDRPLRTVEHFRRFAGETVKIHLDAPMDGRRRYKGTLIGIEDNVVTVNVDGEEFALPLERIAKARVVPTF